MPYRGGCLCGQVRYEARGAALNMGHCYCRDCQKASGSGFIPFMGFAARDVTFAGVTLVFRSPAFRGGGAVPNSRPACGGLVFGGVVGESAQHTIYAGSLDDPSRFQPTMAIFIRDRPAWALLPEGLTCFETMPG